MHSELYVVRQGQDWVCADVNKVVCSDIIASIPRSKLLLRSMQSDGELARTRIDFSKGGGIKWMGQKIYQNWTRKDAGGK